MAKRGAASELNDRNWDQEEEPEEAGTFVQATNDVMQSRVIKRARRRGFQDEEGGSKPVFGGFGGLSKSSSLKSEGTATSVGSMSFGSGKPLFGGASSSNGADEQKGKSHGDSTSYLHALKSLNESVLLWIKQHVEENPYIFLTPIFKDYQTHLDAIESKRSPPKSPGAGGQKEDKNGDNSSGSVKPTPTLATSFQFSSSKQEPSAAKDTKQESASKPFSFYLSGPQTETNSGLFGGLSSSNGGFKFSTSSSTPGFAFSGSTSGASEAPTLGKPSFSFGATSSSGSSSAGTSSMFAGAAAQGSSQSTDSKDDEEYVPPKPEVREIKEDDALYSKRCKLYYQRDGQWVDRGVGNLHLKPVEDNKTQLLIRADTNLGNILLNIMLSSSMPVNRQGKNNVFLVCVPNPAINSKQGEESQDRTPVPMLIRVKTGEDADELFGKMEERKNLLS